jgi:site-specific DNA-methyltransferase (adenine-specific)
MSATPVQTLLRGDCRDHLPGLEPESISACITDPPYNYEFVGRDWDYEEVTRRLERVASDDSTTLVKNLPYGSGLAGGVRNERWYERNRQSVLDYQEWVFTWADLLIPICKPGAPVAVFSSTRTAAHVQVALERAGFYARDCLVYRRSGGIPKGLNAAAKLRKLGDPTSEDWAGWHSALRGEWEAIVLVQKPLETNYLNTLKHHGVGLFRTEIPGGGFHSNILEGIAKEPDAGYRIHCTPKPLALMERLIELFVPAGREHVVLDPFAGSGTTLVAAEQLGRSWVGIEMVEQYCALIERRLIERRGARDEEELSLPVAEPAREVEAAGQLFE